MQCVCLLPLTVGQHYQSDSPDDKQGQDGSIGSLMCGAFLVAFLTSLIVAHWMTLGVSVPIPITLPHAVLCTFMLLGIVSIWALTHCLYHRSWKEPQKDGPQHSNTARHFFMHHLTFIALCIFFVFGVLYDILPIFGDSMCMQEYFQCDRAKAIEKLVEIVCHIMRVIFKFFLMTFVYKYERRCLENRPLIRYCVISVMVAIVSNWFNLLFPDSFAKYFEDASQLTNPSSVTCDHIPYNKNTTQFQCMRESNNFYHFNGLLSQFLMPFNIEFNLIAIKIVATIYNNTKQRKLTETMSNSIRYFHSLPNNRGQGLGFHQTEHTDVANARTPLLHRTGHTINPTNQNGVLTFPLPLLLITVASGVLVVCGILTVLHNTHPFVIYSFLYECILLVIIYKGIISLRRSYESYYSKYTSLEFLLVLILVIVFFGMFLWWFASIGCLLGSQITDKDPPCNKPKNGSEITLAIALWVDLFHAPVNCLEIFMQVTFMVYAKRAKVREGMSGSRDCWWVKQSLLYCSVANLFLWLSDSTVILYVPDLHVQNHYFANYEQWDLVLDIKMPFFYFFRLNSFLIFFQLFLNS